MHGWWGHLFHDPMRDNLWSLVALGVVLVLGGVALVALSYVDAVRLVRTCLQPRRRRPNRQEPCRFCGQSDGRDHECW